MKTVDIVVPVYREEEGIEAFHARLHATTTALAGRYRCHIVYVMDTSPDTTEQKLQKIAAQCPEVTVLVMSRRFGHQAALTAGIDYCTADAVIMLDGDGQHPPELIPSLLDCFEKGADIVQMIRRDSIAVGRMKRLFSAWFYRLYSRMSPIAIPSGSADFRLLSARVAEIFRTELREHNPFLRGLVYWVGFNIVYLPFECGPRERGRTKYSVRRLVSFAINGLCSFSKVPLRMCTAIGFTVAAVSVALGCAEIVAYLLGDRSVPGWASLMLVFSFSSGVQLFFLGVLGEYIGLVFDEVKRRPRYLVGRIHGDRGSCTRPVVRGDTD